MCIYNMNSQFVSEFKFNAISEYTQNGIMEDFPFEENNKINSLILLHYLNNEFCAYDEYENEMDEIHRIMNRIIWEEKNKFNPDEYFEDDFVKEDIGEQIHRTKYKSVLDECIEMVKHKKNIKKADDFMAFIKTNNIKDPAQAWLLFNNKYDQAF